MTFWKGRKKKPKCIDYIEPLDIRTTLSDYEDESRQAFTIRQQMTGGEMQTSLAPQQVGVTLSA